MKWQKKTKQKPIVDLIPLLDTIFLLLIFFLFSMSAMIVHKGIDIQLPNAATATATQSKFQTIGIDALGKLYLNQALLTKQELSDSLAQLSIQKPQPEIFIAADTQAQFGKVLAVMDTLRSFDFKNVSFETEASVQ